MKLTQAIVKRLKEIMSKRNINQYQLFKLTGVPQSTISTILNGELKTIKMSTLYDFCSGLKIEFCDFFNSTDLKLENIQD